MRLLLERGKTLNHCIFPRKHYNFKVSFHSDLKSKSAFFFTKHIDLFGFCLSFKFQRHISNINELSLASFFGHHTSLHSPFIFSSLNNELWNYRKKLKQITIWMFFMLTTASCPGDNIPRRDETFLPIPENMPWPCGRACWWILPELSGISRTSWPLEDDKIKLPP